MRRRPGSFGPLELIILAAIAAPIVLVAVLFVAMVIALAGLGHLSSDLEPSRALAWFWYFRDDPSIRRWSAIGLGCSSLGLVVFLRLIYGVRRTEFGKARWASERELRASGLRSPTGLILGDRMGFLRLGGEEHVLVYAPTRSGKGVGFVIPNLLTWEFSAVVLDVKAENYRATAGRRAAMGQQIHLFDPFAEGARTACYNPLGHIDRADGLVCLRELRKVAILLFPEQHKGGDFFWVGASRNIFVAMGLYVAESPNAHAAFTLGAITRELTASDLRQRLERIIEAPAIGQGALSRLCLDLLRDAAASPENTFANIRQTVMARLSLWLSPEIDNATSSSDFQIADLRGGAVTVYLATGPADLPLIAPLYALIMQQIVEHNARALPEPGDRRQLLLMLDEFARLGPVPVIASAFSFLAGYGVRLAAVIQTPAQLRHLYGPDGAREIIANCGAELVFAPKELEDARNISERLGEYDFPAFSRSRPAGLSPGRRSVSRSDHGRRLMLAHELMTLPSDVGLVIRTGSPPSLCRKIVWYRDRRFRKLAVPAPTVRPLVDLRSDHVHFEPPVQARAHSDLFDAPLQERSR